MSTLIINTADELNAALDSDGDLFFDGNVEFNLAVLDIGNISAVDIRARDISASGYIRAVNVRAVNVRASEIHARDILAIGYIHASDISARDIRAVNVRAVNVIAREIHARDISASGNISARDISASGNISAREIHARDISASGYISARDISASGNISASGYISAVDISASGNIKTSCAIGIKFSGKLECRAVVPATCAPWDGEFWGDRFGIDTKTGCCDEFVARLAKAAPQLKRKKNKWTPLELLMIESSTGKYNTQADK